MLRQGRRWLSLMLPLAVAAVSLAGCGVAQPAATAPSLQRPGRVHSPSSPAAAVTAPRGPSSYEVTDFTPAGARTAWAASIGNRLPRPGQAVLRSGDGGARWSNITPPGLQRAGRRTAISSLDVLGARRAWLAYGPLAGRQTTGLRLVRTSDGGRTWVRSGSTPIDCDVQFVNPHEGWCVALDGATGNMFATIYRTTDGGRAWRQVARSTPPGERTEPTQIPFGCDKAVTFVSRATGFVVSSFCNGGGGYVYRSTDGGLTWHRTLSLPRPTGGNAGAGLTQVVEDGRRDVVGYTVHGYRQTPTGTVLFTSRDGGLRWSKVRPPVASRFYDVDPVSTRVWRLAAGSDLLSTDDGGRTWRRVSAGANLTRRGELWFTTPRVGWDLDLASGHAVLRTTDGGRHWNTVQVPAP